MIYDPEKRVKKNPATNPQGPACIHTSADAGDAPNRTATASVIIAAATATATAA